MTEPHHDRVYKILLPAEHNVLETYGRFAGSEADEQDGFIHLSLASQVHDTLRLHFAQESVWLIELDANALGDALKFEPSRGGALFPHLYGALLGSVVLSATRVPWDGEHQLSPSALESLRL